MMTNFAENLGRRAFVASDDQIEIPVKLSGRRSKLVRWSTALK